MITEIFDTENWTAASLDWLSSELKQKDSEINTHTFYSWTNISKSLSPLDLYKLLKARFGIPNGLSMLFKSESSDNLIHWHYTILSKETPIHFWGNSGGLQIGIKLQNSIAFTDSDWNILIDNIKKSYSKYGKEMNLVQLEFEKWTLFINPYTRLYYTLRDLVTELKKLRLTEVEMYKPSSTAEEKQLYFKKFKKWIRNVDRAALLGTAIRMLSPVLAEAFVNLLILMLSKKEYKEDKRLYESFIRQQIDIRVKTLHLNCNGFAKQIDSEKEEFKKFQTLMNGRNDFLHGNVDPNQLTFEDVYFDQKFIPLFKEDEGIIKKMLKNYLTNVEPTKALDDFKIVNEFTAFVLSHLNKNEKDLLEYLMITRTPGINNKTNRIGILFPPGLAESHL